MRFVVGSGVRADTFFDELGIYEGLGVPRATILQAATANAAILLHKERDFGTIQPGPWANLILVDGGSLTRIADVRNVVLVVKHGRMVMAAELQAALARAIDTLPARAAQA